MTHCLLTSRTEHSGDESLTIRLSLDFNCDLDALIR